MTYRMKKSKSGGLNSCSHFWRTSLKNLYFFVWILFAFDSSFFFFTCGFSIVIYYSPTKLSNYHYIIYQTTHECFQSWRQIHRNRNLPQCLWSTAFLQWVLLQSRSRFLSFRNRNRFCWIYIWRAPRDRYRCYASCPKSKSSEFSVKHPIRKNYHVV